MTIRESRGAGARFRLVCLGCLLAASPTAVPAFADDPAAVTFFQKKVEPLLKRRCYECHSHEAGEAEGGLVLDSRAGWETGGDSGPALVPERPDESRLIGAVRYAIPDLEMPPDGKLTDDEIATLVEWVRRGAADPRGGAAKAKAAIDLDAGRRFWSFRPVADPPAPAVGDEAWPLGEIDRFVLAKLEAQGLRPAPEADRATLARRLYFDLTGLPPTPEQIDAFANDPSPAAYETLVDSLLASRAFGERWGRHWLDLARFAESVTLRGLIFKEAWRYRDYVIDAFDADVPFDRFVREQIAGDLLPYDSPEQRARQLVATTYLQLGNTNLEEQDKAQLRMDVVDEQLDVVSKGLLAMTVTCARCHDHKFDPIPTKDYYALAGIFRNVKALENANVSKWVEVPLPAPPEVEAAAAAHAAAVAELEARVKAAKAAGKSAAAEPSVAGPIPIAAAPGVVVDDSAALKVGDWKDSVFNGVYVGAGYVHDLNERKGEKTITFDPELPASGEYEVWLAYSAGDSRTPAAPVSVFSPEGEKAVPVDMRLAPPIGGRFLSLGRYRFEKDGQCFVLVATEGTVGHVTADAVCFIPVAEVAAAEKKFARPAGKGGELASLEAELKKLRAAAPKRPMAMGVLEEAKAEDVRVHVRGSVHNLGEPAPRGFLQVAPPAAPAMPANESGRRELADWLASPQNPLTARVFANRAWHWLFGAGLVRTVDNFGTTGETPSHPELLDHLATRFVEDGWSVKRLVRAIVLSRAYRQSAAADPAAAGSDPENRLLARANVRRLDAECLRDAMLVAGGNLTAFGGGPSYPADASADYAVRTAATYRSVYLPVLRNSLPEIFEAFDFADASTVTGRRNTGTVPQQALFLTNNPFALGQARLAAAALLAAPESSDEGRATRAYRVALGRAPTEAERRAVAGFVASRPGPPETAWALVFQALFASPEFRYLE